MRKQARGQAAARRPAIVPTSHPTLMAMAVEILILYLWWAVVKAGTMAGMAVMSQAEGRVGGARLCAPPSSLHILPLLFTMTILTLPIYDHYFALYQFYVHPTYIPNKTHPLRLQFRSMVHVFILGMLWVEGDR